MEGEIESLWLVHCMDSDQSDVFVEDPTGGPRMGHPQRMSSYADHKKYQSQPLPDGLRKICAGPMLTDDGLCMIGSAFVLQGTRSRVEVWINADPFLKRNVWKQAQVARYFPVNGIQEYN